MRWVGRKRLVRLHLEGAAPSLEGLLVGTVNGHYHMKTPKMLEAVGHTAALEGELLVPRERVLFIQTMP